MSKQYQQIDKMETNKMSRVMRKRVIEAFDKVNTKRPLHSQKVKSLFCFGFEGLYCLYSKNKYPDQLCRHHIADLRLYFCIGKNLLFS